MGQVHIVWDWNGTLFDDLPVVILAANASMARFGVGPIDEDGYRDHFTRPVRAFYDSLFGRLVSDVEWEDLNDRFHDEYFALADTVSLMSDALDALSAVEDNGWGQSLLSVSPQGGMERIVGARGVARLVTLVGWLVGHYGGLLDDRNRTCGG